MRKLAWGLAAVLLLASSFPALAGLGPNGLGPNGLGPNGLGPNGLGPNGLGPNGLGPNGLGPNGLGPNGLGPNGLGPNGLGPNGLDVNGLGPNGLGPNGLGPNGLPITFFVVEPGYTIPRGEEPSAFETWFEGDPASASQFMKYFARCAYDGNTGIAYQDSTLKAWAWTGQYGFAMGSLKSAALETLTLDPGSPPVRARMTTDEGKWVSACILAHVNVQGTHQYISLRGNPPNVEAQAALKPTPGELWTMRPASIYFGNLFDVARDLSGAPIPWMKNQMASLNTGEGDAPTTPLWNRAVLLGTLNAVLGRDCDATSCGYSDASGASHTVIENPFTALEKTFAYVGHPTTYLTFQDHPQPAGEFSLAGIQTDPVHPFDSVARWTDIWTVGETANRPLFVGMPAFDLFQPGPPLSPLEMPTKSITSTGAVPIQPGQYVEGTAGTMGAALVGLTAGQSLEQVRTAPGGLALASPAIPVDMSESFTAIVRYANPRSTAAAARLEASDSAGGMRNVGTEIWPSTGASTAHTWLQVYPVQPYVDANGNVSMRVRFSGAVSGENCSGAKLVKGDGETGTCALKSVYFDWKRLKVMCRESGESKPVCRGDLVFDYRGGKWAWFCAYGGGALYACTAADAPELDAAAFVPGKPWCAPEGATSFTGVCD
jgi:hypothetical protein